MTTYYDPVDLSIDIFRSHAFQTQDLNIGDQLEAGIRYFDLRIEVNESRELYLSNAGADCYNKETGGLYFLSEILDEIINFLNKHDSETVIIHLKKENIMKNENGIPYLTNTELAKRIRNLTIKNENLVPFNEDKQFKDFYYNGSTIPTLNRAKGHIVIFSHENYLSEMGITLSVPGMGGCEEYSNSGGDHHGPVCYPVILDDNYLFQDNYNLEEDDKWDIVYDVLTNNVDCRSDNKTNGEYAIYPKTSDYVTKFYKKNNKDILIIDFMNMARANLDWRIISDFVDSSIKSMANDVNKHLGDFNEKPFYPFYHHWFILDFPSSDVICKVYLSNNFDIPKNGYSKRSVINNDLNISNDYLTSPEYNDDLNIYLDSNYYIYNVTLSKQNGKK